MVRVVAEPETVVKFMVWLVAEHETVVEFMSWGVAERETVVKFVARSSQSMRLSRNSWRGGGSA